VDALYTDYLKTVERLERDRRPGEGLFGTKGPADDPCHDRFASDLGSLLHDFAAEEPDSDARRAVLEAVFAAPLTRPAPKSAYWMLVAVQSLTRDLIGGLSREDAAALAARYAEDYPRRVRLPVQNELLSLLREKGGSAAPRRSLFRRNG
jgi:hypothetical protein